VKLDKGARQGRQVMLGEDGGWPEVSWCDPDGLEAGVIELKACWQGGIRELQIEVRAGGLWGRPAAPVRELLGGSTQLHESGGATPPQGVPGAVWGSEAERVGEADSRGQRSGAEGGTEVVHPAADKWRGGAPAESAVSFGGVNPNAAGAEGVRAKSDSLANSQQVDEGDENKAVEIRVCSRGCEVGGEELVEREPGSFWWRSEPCEGGHGEPKGAWDCGRMREGRGSKRESRQKCARGTGARGIGAVVEV